MKWRKVDHAYSQYFIGAMEFQSNCSEMNTKSISFMGILLVEIGGADNGGVYKM